MPQFFAPVGGADVPPPHAQYPPQPQPKPQPQPQQDKNKTEITIPCLYTKQLTKKRKTFQDGKLVCNTKSNYCRLFRTDGAAASGNDCLEGLQVTSAAMAKILDGEFTELEFETYLVTVEHIVTKAPSAAKPVAMQQQYKIPRFKPPAQVAPPKVVENPNNEKDKMQSGIGRSTGAYSVANEEIDSIWDDDDEGDGKQDVIISRGTTRDEQHHQHNERHIQSINHGFEGHSHSSSHRHQGQGHGQGHGQGQGQFQGQGLGGNHDQYNDGMGQQIRVVAPRGPPIQNKENVHSYDGYDDPQAVDGEQIEATAKDVWDEIAMTSGSSNAIDSRYQSTNNRSNGNQSNNNINSNHNNSNSNHNNNHSNNHSNSHSYQNEDADDDDDIWGQIETLPVSSLPVQPSIASMSHQQNSCQHQQPPQRQQQQQQPYLADTHRSSQPTHLSTLDNNTNTTSRTDAPVLRPHQPSSSHSYSTNHSQSSYQAHDANIPEGFFSSMASTSAPGPGLAPGPTPGQGQWLSNLVESSVPSTEPATELTEASIWDF